MNKQKKKTCTPTCARGIWVGNSGKGIHGVPKHGALDPVDLPLTAGDIFDGPYQPIGLDRVALQPEADRDVLVDAEFIHFVVDTDVQSDVVSVKRVINQVEFLHVGESYEISVANAWDMYVNVPHLYM